MKRGTKRKQSSGERDGAGGNDIDSKNSVPNVLSSRRLGQELYRASKAKNLQEAKRLIEAGALINWRFSGDPWREGATPLWIASEKNHTAIVKLLIDRGADVNVIAGNNFTPLIAAASTYAGRSEEAARLLVEEGEAVTTVRDTWNADAADWFAHHRNWAMVRYLRSLPKCIRFCSTAHDENGRLHRVKGRAKRAVERDLGETGLLPTGPLSIIKEFATG